MPSSMAADPQVNKTMNYSRHFTVNIWKVTLSGELMKIFASVGRLEVLSTLNFSEATSGHPEFYVEKHGLLIFKTPASVLIYAKLSLCKQ